MTPTFVLSLDFELAWGAFDVVPTAENLACAEWTHAVGAPLLLDRLAHWQLPATWATVGLLMEDGLPRSAEALPEVSYPHWKNPWFNLVPRRGGAKAAPGWFAPELVERIRNERVGHDLGFHGYSHVVFDDPGTPAERAEAELAACRELANRLGFAGTSFVYPRNGVAHLDRLAAHGFRVYRSRDPRRFLPAAAPARGLTGVLADAIGLGARPVRPVQEPGGLVALPGSAMLRFAEGWRGWIPDAARRRRLHRGLDHVLEEGGIFHVWLHPVNLYAGHPRLIHVLDDLFARVAREREAGRLQVRTMADFAEPPAPREGQAPPHTPSPAEAA